MCVCIDRGERGEIERERNATLCFMKSTLFQLSGQKMGQARNMLMFSVLPN